MTDIPILEFVETGEPETGLWCDVCSLPSRVRIPVYLLTDCGVRRLDGDETCTKHEVVE